MNKLVIMESTFNILPEKDKKEVLEKGTIKQVESETQTVKYLIIED